MGRCKRDTGHPPSVEYQTDVQELLDRIEEHLSEGLTTLPTEEKDNINVEDLLRRITEHLSEGSVNSTSTVSTSEDLKDEPISQGEVSATRPVLIPKLIGEVSATRPVLIPELWEANSLIMMNDSGKTLKEKRKKLLRWCRKKVKPYGLPMLEFCESWKSGRAIIALIHSYDKNLVETRFLTNESPVDTIRYGDKVARSLGVTCPKDFVSVCTEKWPHQLIVMAYVMELRYCLKAMSK